MEKPKITALFTILILLLIFWGIFYLIAQPPISKLKPAEKFEEGLPSKVFKISGGEGIYPQFFKEVIFKPYEVATGDTQIFSIWIKDPMGVEKAAAEIETDTENVEVEFQLKEGDNKNGLWSGSWHVCNYRDKDYYEIVFKAQSLNGNENIFTGFIKNKEYKK